MNTSTSAASGRFCCSSDLSFWLWLMWRACGRHSHGATKTDSLLVLFLIASIAIPVVLRRRSDVRAAQPSRHR